MDGGIISDYPDNLTEKYVHLHKHNTMNKEQLIEEARKRGIVEGATCVSVYGAQWIVGPVERWRPYNTGPNLYDRDGESTRCICDDGKWATVLTPAPQEGLVDGMACEPDPHMRAAIIAKAKELGMTDGEGYDSISLNQLIYRPNGSWKLLQTHRAENLLPPGEFYDRLCRMTPNEKPILIDNREVKFTGSGNIKVGCTSIPWEVLEVVYTRAKAQR